MKPWQPEVDRLSSEFKGKLSRVEKWIKERHSGVGGTVLAIGDWLTGLPDWDRGLRPGRAGLRRRYLQAGARHLPERQSDHRHLRGHHRASPHLFGVGWWADFGQRLDGLRDEATKTRTHLNKQLAEKQTRTSVDSASGWPPRTPADESNAGDDGPA